MKQKLLSIILIQIFFITSSNLCWALAVPSQISKLDLSKTNLEIIHEKQKNHEDKLIILTQRPFTNEFFKLTYKLNGEWRKFGEWSQKIFLRAKIINIILGLISFGIMFILIFYISLGALSPIVIAVWIGLLILSVLAKVFFEKNNEVLYERVSYSLGELLKKEHEKYSELKVYDNRFKKMDPDIMSVQLAMWKLGENRVIDFLLSIVGGMIAVSIYNPVFIIPYLALVLVTLGALYLWAISKKSCKTEYYKKRNNLSQKNRLVSSVSRQDLFSHWDKDISKQHDRYFFYKTGVDVVLRFLIMVLIPVSGILLFLFMGSTLAPLLFYIFAISLIGIFSLMDFFISMHNGGYAREVVYDFVGELVRSKIIINRATWNKKFKGAKTDVNKIDKLFLKDCDLLIQDGKNKIDIKNINIELPVGEVHGLFGKSGSGKTSIMQLMGARLFLNKTFCRNDNLFKSSGALYAGGVEVSPRNFSYNNLNHLVSYVSFEDALIFNNNLDFLSKDEKAGFDCYINEFIPNFSSKNVSTLSSGEKSRVKLALVLALNKSKFILLDQPFVNIDFALEKNILDILKNYARLNKVGIMVAQPEFSVDGYDRVMKLEDGRVVDVGKYA